MYRANRLFSAFNGLVLLFWLAVRGIGYANEMPHIVVDANTGLVLSQVRANDQWHPASLTKLMTAWVTFRAIEAGEIEHGSPVVISKVAARQPTSRMGYKPGVTLRVDTALKIIVVKSANDVSLALAESVAGTLEMFVERMNAEAIRLGMSNTRFANANGLHNPVQVTSARDMAVLSAKLLNSFPQYADLFRATAIETGARKYYSHNLLLERFSGANGLKTGFVCASGYNLAASATRGGRTIIAVVLGRSSQTDRAVSAAKLLVDGFFQTGKGSVYAPAHAGAPPVNMRSVLCTQEARAARYDPGAGAAVIDSPYLETRKLSGRVLEVRTGGVDAAPSRAMMELEFAALDRIPVPSPRPNYSHLTGKIKLSAIGRATTGFLPLPTPSPRS